MASNDTKTAEATATIKEIAALDVSDPTTHGSIIQKCQSVINALQNPLMVFTGVLASGTKHPCIVALSNMGVFAKLTDADGPLTATQLAEECGADRLLVVRLMRVVTGEGIVLETGPETYAATAITKILAMPASAAGLRINHRVSEILNDLPSYLKQTQYRQPASYTDGLFQYHFKTDLGSFEYRARNDEWTRDFNHFMTLPTKIAQDWTEQFDAKTLIFGDGVEINPDVPLFVDIAGGMGQDLRLLKKHLGSDVITKRGQLVLEDQPQVIDNIAADLYDEEFEYVKHNFFTPQPVRGARVYHLKSVLHDWPDDRAIEILRHTASSLAPGYSRIWILDSIVPDTGVPKGLAWVDITMMALFASHERTKEQWAQLLADAGLRIAKLHYTPAGSSLIEAELEA
ncbi:S-adenosyl-L-methionine-dependent methyltransferase [Aspergillus granulosus]|uniref:S-adenosyl-L-methionine-dependent methyltransferase n=1 Tax=Aspergillus granulosus TaxID=176169 RepID=A0ABR4HT48_9EURO